MRLLSLLLLASCAQHVGRTGELLRPANESVEVSPFHPVLATGEGELSLRASDGVDIALSRVPTEDGTWLVPADPLPFDTAIGLYVDGYDAVQHFVTADPAARRVGTTAEAFAAVDDARPAAGSEAYVPPEPAELQAFRAALDQMLRGDWDVDAPLAELGYAWAATEDAGRWRLLLWESPATAHRGAFAFAFDAPRGLVVEAPHPEFDSDTGDQAVEAFLALDAAALFVSGTHRCANAETSPCDGTTSVCGTAGPYAISDAAHDDQAFFQEAHVATALAWPESIAVQLHGFAWDGSEPAAYVSDGTTAEDPASASLVLRDALETALPAYTAASCNDSADAGRLCGTTNTQGRASNGSPEACGTAATAASGRFVHLEQARVLRTDERAAVIEALGVLSPPPPHLR